MYINTSINMYICIYTRASQVCTHIYYILVFIYTSRYMPFIRTLGNFTRSSPRRRPPVPESQTVWRQGGAP